MIELSFEQFAILIVGGAFLFMGFLMFVHRWRAKKYRRKRYLQVVICPVCSEVFDDRTSEKMPICPGCGRKTLRGNDKSLG